MKTRQLLREWQALTPESGFLVEDRSANGGRLFLKGPMQRAEALNQNKRIYPRQILQREFENYRKPVKESRATGELDHPDTSTVSLEKVSHIVREMGWDGDTWMGRIEILPTPMGKIAETLIENGVVLGISSRGVGSTSKNEDGEGDVVQDDFQLIAFDLVQEPSTHGAFMRLGESVERATLSRADRINRVLIDLKTTRKR